jgi:Na+-transporting methylmalonyl-CoA/oxaloacetate decarboxylase gamma subunit
MGIVICALIILSILFMGFGKISQRMHARKKLEAHGVDPNVVTTDDSELDSGEAIAAIAAALHQHFSARHDVEDTVLTMRKLKRAYSPWSSKIYGLREIPNRNTWRR